MQQSYPRIHHLTVRQRRGAPDQGLTLVVRLLLFSCATACGADSAPSDTGPPVGGRDAGVAPSDGSAPSMDASVAIEAGPDRRVHPCEVVQIRGQGPSGAAWAVESGPGELEIAEPARAVIDVFPTVEGEYVLRYSNGADSDTMVLRVAFEIDELTEAAFVEAVDTAQQCPGDHTITLTSAGTLELTQTVEVRDLVGGGENDLRIVGQGTGMSVITGTERLLEVGGVGLEIDGIDFDNPPPSEPFRGGSVATLDEGSSLRLSNLVLRDSESHSEGLIRGGGARVELLQVQAMNNPSGGIVRLTGELLVEGGTYRGNRGGSGGVFSVQGSVTIRDAVLDGNSARRGGALWVAGDLTVERVRFESNVADDGSGGAVYLETEFTVDASADIRGATFLENSASNSGGAMYIDPMSARLDVRIADSSFRENIAGTSDSRGGGAINSFGNLTIEDCTFEGNAAHQGGAIRASDFKGGGIDIIRASSFSNNSATNRGGALDLSGIDGLLIESTTFTANSSAGNAGAIRLLNMEVVLDDVAVNGNSSEGRGGGIETGGGELTLRNSSVTANEAGMRGGGIDASANDLFLRGSTSVSGNMSRAAEPAGGGVCFAGLETFEGRDKVSGNDPDDFCR